MLKVNHWKIVENDLALGQAFYLFIYLFFIFYFYLFFDELVFVLSPMNLLVLLFVISVLFYAFLFISLAQVILFSPCALSMLR